MPDIGHKGNEYSGQTQLSSDSLMVAEWGRSAAFQGAVGDGAYT